MDGPDPELERLRTIARDAHARYERLSRSRALVPDLVFIETAERLWKAADAAVLVHQANKGGQANKGDKTG